MLGEYEPKLRHEHDIAATSGCLDLGGLPVAAELATNVDEAVVDVMPLEAKRFAEPETGEDQDGNQRSERPGIGQEVRNLGVVEHAFLGLRELRTFAAFEVCYGIRGNQPPPLGFS